MNTCLIPLLVAMFGSFMFFGVSQTQTVEVEPPAPVEQAEVMMITSASVNAEAYIMATAAGDVEGSKEFVCAENAEELVAGTTEGVTFSVENLQCTDNLNGQVSCSFVSDLGALEESAEIEVLFGIDETTSLVCEVAEMKVDGVTLE